MRLLHISASPRGSRSESLELAAEYVEAYRRSHPDTVVEHWDLWDGTLPAFGPQATGAKMAVFAGEPFDADQATAWAEIMAAFDRFDRADRYVFSVPMWNHGIPYILKQFIDVVSQPGAAFGFDPEHGYSGLLRNKHATVIYTSAVYGDGRGKAFGSDFQAPYLEDWLRWTGIDDIETISFRPNLVTADADEHRCAAHVRARDLGTMAA